MTTSILAVAYYRKSNEDGGESIEQQQGWAREACRREGVEIAQEFADQAKKGWETAKRTAFHEMLAFCQEQNRRGAAIDAIVCWHANRFSRADSQETSWFIWEFRKAGVQRMFTASNAWIDFNRMEDRVLFNIVQDTSSHRFVMDLAQACTRGRINAAKEGRPLGPRPYGYVKEHEEVPIPGKGKRRRPKRLVPGDPAEIEIVRWLFQTYATTITSTRRLSRELNRRGIKSPKRARGWNHQAIEKILRNPVYLGVVAYGKTGFGKFFRVVEGEPRQATDSRVVPNDPSTWITGERGHEPLIDQETFEEVQRRLLGNKKNSSPRAGIASPLTGLMKCACCGYAMASRKKRQNKEGESARDYFCLGYNTYGPRVCGQNTISEDLLMGVLLRKLRARFLDPDGRRLLRAEIEAQESAGQGNKAAEAVRLGCEIQALDEKVQKAARRLLEEDEGLLPVLRQQLREMQQEQERLKGQLAGLEQQGEPDAGFEQRMDRAAALVGRLLELYRKADPATLRDVLTAMVSGIELLFEHRMVGTRKHSQFVRGVVHLQKDVSLESSPGPCFKNQMTWRIVERVDGQPWLDKPVTLQDGATQVSPFVVLN